MRKTLLAASLVTLLCGACGAPDKPPTEDQPKPQSAAAGTPSTDASSAQATQLRDAIREPIDKAKAVDQQVQQDADNERAAIDAAGG